MSKFQVEVKWHLSDAGRKTEISTKDRLLGDAASGRQAIDVADRVLSVYTSLHGGGAIAEIRRNDGDTSQVCRTVGVTGSGLPWRAMLLADASSRKFLSGRA